MALSLQFNSFLVLILFVDLFCGVHGDITHRTNVRCTNICKDEKARVAQVSFFLRHPSPFAN